MEEYGYTPLQVGNDGSKMGVNLSRGEEGGVNIQGGIIEEAAGQINWLLWK